MDFLQFAAQLNQEGAACLAAAVTSSGSDVINNKSAVAAAAAFEYFRNALEVMLFGVPDGKELLANNPEFAQGVKPLFVQTQRYRNLLWTNTTNSAACATNDAVHPPHGRAEQAAETNTRSSTTTTCIFRKAFIFQPGEDRDRLLSVRIRTYLAMILFNLAMTIHQTSTTNHDQNLTTDGGRGKQETGALMMALELYDAGFDLLLQDEHCCADDWSTNISLAILNNVAQVHWALSDFAKASRVLELQKGLLDIIVSNQRPHTFSDQEMELFVLNTHLLQAPSGAAAA